MNKSEILGNEFRKCAQWTWTPSHAFSLLSFSPFQWHFSQSSFSVFPSPFISFRLACFSLVCLFLTFPIHVKADQTGYTRARSVMAQQFGCMSVSQMETSHSYLLRFVFPVQVCALLEQIQNTTAVHYHQTPANGTKGSCTSTGT